MQQQNCKTLRKATHLPIVVSRTDSSGNLPDKRLRKILRRKRNKTEHPFLRSHPNWKSKTEHPVPPSHPNWKSMGVTAVIPLKSSLSKQERLPLFEVRSQRAHELPDLPPGGSLIVEGEVPMPPGLWLLWYHLTPGVVPWYSPRKRRDLHPCSLPCPIERVWRR